MKKKKIDAPRAVHLSFPAVTFTRAKDGSIVPQNGSVMTAEQMQRTIPALASLLYDGPDAAEYPGMTNFEVANMKAVQIAAATGDPEAVERLNDRVIGRPVQKTVQLTASLSEVLDAIKGGVTPDVAHVEPRTVIDVEAFGDGL